MSLKITLFITILVYSVLISQSFFYILAMARTLRGMQAATFIESRHLLDKNLKPGLTMVYYCALISCILLAAFCVTNPGGVLFSCSVIALVALVVDIIFFLKGNLPLNRTINSWSRDKYPHNWQNYRTRWMSIYQKRQVANLIGFISLLAGIVFTN